MLQVAFSLTIPAMLLASTTKTLTNTQSANLMAIPIIAVAQIALGAAFGRWAAAAVEGRLWLTRVLFGWGDLNPTPSAAAIAASTAAALRAPMVSCYCCMLIVWLLWSCLSSLHALTDHGRPHWYVGRPHMRGCTYFNKTINCILIAVVGSV